MPQQPESKRRRKPKAPVIAFLSDFSTIDGYVGAVKGVLASSAPKIPIVDITHDIAAGDVAAARWCLLNCAAQFPARTVFLAIIDPGVGTRRPALALASDNKFFVGPHNGIFDWVLGEDAQAIRLNTQSSASQPISATFHGRDLFAPAVAHLAMGGKLAELGEPFSLDVDALGIPQPRRDAEGWLGIVLSIDRFGNVVTNLPAKIWSDGMHLAVGRYTLEAKYHTYGDIPSGKAGVVIGSLGYLEAAMFDASFAATASVVAGDPVRLFEK